MATLKPIVWRCSACKATCDKVIDKCRYCGVAFTAEALKPSYNSVRDAIVALYGKWRVPHVLVDTTLVDDFVDFVKQQHP